jgi:hypothetical protein
MVDLNSLKILPPKFSRYCEISSLKKDNAALLHSPYLLSVKGSPHNMTLKLARALIEVVPGLGQKIFDRACCEQNKEEAKLLLRFLWLQNQISKSVKVDQSKIP